MSCFLQNEDVLKKCAQEYLSRVRKEEQRYQALKIHAEEKLDKWVDTLTSLCLCLGANCEHHFAN